MSDITLTAIATDYASKTTKEMLAKIKEEDWTEKGRLDLIESTIMFAYMAGHKLGVERCQE